MDAFTSMYASTAAFNSDTLRIELSESMQAKTSSHNAFQLLHARNLVESFGEIAHLEKCPGDSNAVVVTYFDLRAAAAARDTFGEESSSWEAMRGKHTLRFRQEELQAAVMNNIADVSVNEDWTYTVRFFDSRTAHQCEAVRVMCFGTPPLSEEACPAAEIDAASLQEEVEEPAAEKAVSKKASISQAPTVDTLAELSEGFSVGKSSASSDAGSSSPAASSGEHTEDPLQSTLRELLQAKAEEEEASGPAAPLQQLPEPIFLEVPTSSEAPAATETVKPKYLNDLRQTAVSWEDISSKKEKRTTLRLRCLPQRLCQPGALESLLAAHHLSDAVEKIKLSNSQAGVSKSRMGTALLKAKTVEDVPRLAKFFHGRQLGGLTPISVSFAAEQGCGLIPSRAKATPKSEPCYIPLQTKKESELLDFPPGLEIPSGLAC